MAKQTKHTQPGRSRFDSRAGHARPGVQIFQELWRDRHRAPLCAASTFGHVQYTDMLGDVLHVPSTCDHFEAKIRNMYFGYHHLQTRPDQTRRLSVALWRLWLLSPPFMLKSVGLQVCCGISNFRISNPSFLQRDTNKFSENKA